jgi:AMP-binding enzyme/Phosphopantetheine attachment site
VIPLEGPFFPARFHILDKKMRPVPFGVPGEMYIAGPNVSRAYVNRPDVTAAAFFEDTWAPAAEIEIGYGSLYRTGDLFRANRDGTIDILGRIGSDRQVKIRGMRTELGEIENVIWDAYESAKDEHNLKLSLVAVVYHRKPDSQDGVMAAYLSLAEDSLATSAEDKGRFRAYLSISLKASLPPHMLPAVFIFADDLPRTISGKVDYKIIAQWPAPTVTSSAATSNNNSTYELTEVQTMIASVWKDILSIDSNLGPNDEFFALGGHSLMLVTLQQKLAAVSGVTIKLQDMFAYPSIAGFEKLILNGTESARENLASDVSVFISSSFHKE